VVGVRANDRDEDKQLGPSTHAMDASSKERSPNMTIRREALVFFFRTGESDDEVLILHRAPDDGGYWHAVAGALEDGETAAEAAVREGREETGFNAQGQLLELGRRHAYPPTDEAERRKVWCVDQECVPIESFAVRVPAGWEPRLNAEHDAYRWCHIDDALALLYWPDAKDALSALARVLDGRRG
jgi:dATP pyrophosphohydrolase